MLIAIAVVANRLMMMPAASIDVFKNLLVVPVPSAFKFPAGFS
jgi:hypothetical protein